jgi:Zn-dependent protease with chaperone function
MSHNKLARRLTRLENRQRREATALKAEIARLNVNKADRASWDDFEALPSTHGTIVAGILDAAKLPQSKSFGNGEPMAIDELMRRLR